MSNSSHKRLDEHRSKTLQLYYNKYKGDYRVFVTKEAANFEAILAELKLAELKLLKKQCKAFFAKAHNQLDARQSNVLQYYYDKYKGDYHAFVTEEVRFEDIIADHNLFKIQCKAFFAKVTKAHKRIQKRIERSKYPPHTQHSDPKEPNDPKGPILPYCFGNITIKATNTEIVTYQPPTESKARQVTRQCICWSRHERKCIEDIKNGAQKDLSNCPHLSGKKSLVATECTFDNCSNPGDCGNRYSPELGAKFHGWKTVICLEHSNKKVVMYGLKVKEGEVIPRDGIIGEYTGNIIDAEEVKDSKSNYIVDMENGKAIDAETVGNFTRFINHRCLNANAIYLPVDRVNGQRTVFVRAIREISGGEFISTNYHDNTEYVKKHFFDGNICVCDDCVDETKC